MIDMHSHTLYSDGSNTPDEVLEIAEEKGLDYLAITDHNTVDEYYNMDYSLFSGRIIPGIEMTTTYKGEIIEVLGLGIDIDKMHELLPKYYLKQRDKMIKEYELILAAYRKLGLTLDETKLVFDPDKESSRGCFIHELKRHPENLKHFLHPEFIEQNVGFTRYEMYNPKSAFYVDESPLYPSLEKVIEIIHECGGYAFLAHTYAYSSNIIDALYDIINNYELDGLECVYTTFTDEQSKHLMDVCKERGLYMSGGSDYHGKRKKDHFLGVVQGDKEIPNTIISEWLEMWDKKNGSREDRKVYTKSKKEE